MLTLNDQALLVPRFRKINIPLSEYSFANLFLFRKKHSYKILEVEGDVYVHGLTYDGVETLMPTFVPELAKIKRMVEKGFTFYPIPEQWLEKFAGEFFFTNREEDNDYLFKQEKIANYPGRELRGKHNLVVQFERNYKVEIAPLNITFMKDAFEVLKQWTNISANPNDDSSECKEALENLEALFLTGLIFYVEKQPIAFLVGEQLTDHVYVIHFVKGLKEYKGLYPYIYQQLAKRLPTNMWLNFEQDLGLSGLRQAKHSFHPDSYGLKFRISC